MRLLDRAEKEGVTVLLVSEAYTSKVYRVLFISFFGGVITSSLIFRQLDARAHRQCCSRCGTLDENLGGSEVFHCQRCDLRVGRDAQGAYNVFLRFATEALQCHADKRAFPQVFFFFFFFFSERA